MFLRQNQSQPRWYTRSLALSAMLLVFGSASYGQTPPRPNPPPPAEPPSTNPTKDDSSGPDFGSPESEMRAKWALKEEKKRYDEHLSRAREASQLASQLCKSYETKKAFNSEDGKRLERLEKLTKRIRNEAGGSDDEINADVRDIPGVMEAALKRVAELADDLQKMVEKTPRQVVSAAVIDQANKLIGLVQHVRNVCR